MSITELKAKAYDLLVLIERAQLELRETNQKIAEEGKKLKEEPKKKD